MGVDEATDIGILPGRAADAMMVLDPCVRGKDRELHVQAGDGEEGEDSGGW